MRSFCRKNYSMLMFMISKCFWINFKKSINFVEQTQNAIQWSFLKADISKKLKVCVSGNASCHHSHGCWAKIPQYMSEIITLYEWNYHLDAMAMWSAYLWQICFIIIIAISGVYLSDIFTEYGWNVHTGVIVMWSAYLGQIICCY